MADEKTSLEPVAQIAEASGVWRRNLEGWARALFDGIEDAIFVHDLHGRILDANPAASRRLGYSRDELLKLSTTDIDDADFAGDFNHRLERQLTEGNLRCVGKHRCKDGRTILVDINSSVIEFHGKPSILAVMRDITEQVRVEKSLRESQAFYHSLVETLPQNLFRKNHEGRLTFANQRYCDLMGMSLTELVGKNDFDLFPEHLAKKYVADDRKVVGDGKPVEVVEEHQTPTGEKLYVQVIKTPIHDPGGQVIGIQGLFWDVTERIRFEEALAESERRYRELTEATQDAIILADHQGNITLFNPAAERLFDFKVDEILGMPVTQLMSPEYAQRHQEGIKRFMQTRTSKILGKPIEMQGRRKNGTEFPIEVVLTALNAESEEPAEVQFLGAIRDLTERNRMRSVLVQNEKLASIGLLSAGVAHEINNPLAYIANNMAVLERDLGGVMKLVNQYEKALPVIEKTEPNLAAKLRAFAVDIDYEYTRENLDRLIDRTREGVDRVAKIVQSLRGLARTSKPEKQPANLPDLIDSSLEMVRNRVRRLNIQVETRYPPNPTVTCVPTQIAQVLLNLLVNATQAIESAQPPGGGKIDILVQRLDEHMLIQVKDNGSGIPADRQPHIFDPFFTTKDVGEGTGLGLSISHNIITGHGGRIEVESDVGRETVFSIWLPLDANGK